jgi:hypothetical protein
MIGPRFGPAFSTRLDDLFRQSLESTRFLETPMPSLFHLELPLVEAHQRQGRDRWIIVSCCRAKAEHNTSDIDS